MRYDSPLGNLNVASPCSADWDAMYGDERKRFCGQCKLNVYNLSGMTRDEAESLIMNAEGRLCVRFYRRADGTVITQDCPVGWARVKQRTRATLVAMASLLMALVTGVLSVSLFSRRESPVVGKLLIPFATPTPEPIPLMGAIAPVQGKVIMGTPVIDREVKPNSNRKLEKVKLKVLAQESSVAPPD